MPKIIITTTTFGRYDSVPLNLLQQANLEVNLNPYSRKLKPTEVIELGQGTVGIIAGTESLTQEVIKSIPTLKVISRCGVGLDNVDLKAAQELNIQVFNTPFGPTLAVAELTIGLILNILRKVTLMDREIRAGKWQKRMGCLLKNKKVGIIGFGRIGKEVAKLLLFLGAKVNFCDPAISGDLLSCNNQDLDTILQDSDIVCLHVSSMAKGNSYLLGHNELRAMKNGAYLINCSRGGIVDENALHKVLKEGYLSGAAIDVFENEPYLGPLQELENVILTPHIGSYARETRTEMEKQSVVNLLKGLKEVGII